MANRWFNQFTWTLEKNPVCLFLKSVQGDSSTVTTVADSSSNLAGTFFRIKGFVTGRTYMFWFKVGGSGTNPASAGDTAIEVDFTANSTNVQVAAAIIAAASASTLFVSDFTVGTISGHTATFTALGGGCANAHDGASMFATSFTFANSGTVPILAQASSLGIKTFVRTGIGLYTVTFGTAAPTSTTDIYNRLFDVSYCPVSTAAPAAPKVYVVSETVATDGKVNLKFTAEDGTTAADPACGDIALMQFYLKNTTAN